MATKKRTFTAEVGSQLADTYYDKTRTAKVAAGLSLAAATEVTARQRAEDEVNGVALSLDELETPPEA